MIGTQEIIAIIIVVVIVGFGLYRRMRKKAASAAGCTDCDHNPSKNASEKPVRFYRKPRRSQ